MQRIIHQYRNCSRVFTILEAMYSRLSDTEGICDDVIWVNESFRDLCEILSANMFEYQMPEFKDIHIPVVPYDVQNNKEITVCLSGGKDSAAVAWYYKVRGYTVHLYHVTGVNKAYGDEKKAAEKIAKYLGCDLLVDKILLSGTQPFIEHPMKNYVIANGAIHFCIARGYALNIAFGNFSGSHLDDNVFDVCAGDCVEMWNAYEQIVRVALPNFNLELPLETNADTFRLLKDDWQLFNLCVSCMSPFRFRAHWKHRTEEKYNVRIAENRCGCCWKCAVEELWLMDKGFMRYNEKFYRHCLGILIQTLFKEADTKEDLQTVWDNYMFYPILGSHAEKYLNGYRIRYKRNSACEFIEV